MNIQSIKLSSLSNAYESRSLLLFDTKTLAEFWLKSFALPNITINNGNIDYIGHPLVTEGAMLTFGELSADVYMDENFAVYKEQYDWITSMIPGETYTQGKRSGSILILDNSLRNILVNFHFEGLLLVSVGGFSYNNYGSKELFLSLSFKFDRFYPEFLLTYPTL